MGSLSATELLNRVSQDRDHGSRQLTLWALDCLSLAVNEFRADNVNSLYMGILELGSRLAYSRPLMASITNAIGYVIYTLNAKIQATSAVEELRGVAQHAIAFVKNEVDASANRVGTVFRKVASSHKSFVTLSFSSTVLSALLSVRPETVYVAESRPRLEGKKLGEELSRSGLQAILTLDSVAPSLVAKVDAVVFGADTVYVDGSVLNKVGSRTLALAGKIFKRPVYLVFDRWKLSPERRGNMFASEEEDPGLLRGDADKVMVYAPLFEVTEGELITHYVSEFGIMGRDEISKRAGELKPMRAALLSQRAA